MPPEETNQETIDIGLNLLNEQDTQALREFSNAVNSLKDSLRPFQGAMPGQAQTTQGYQAQGGPSSSRAPESPPLDSQARAAAQQQLAQGGAYLPPTTTIPQAPGAPTGPIDDNNWWQKRVQDQVQENKERFSLPQRFGGDFTLQDYLDLAGRGVIGLGQYAGGLRTDDAGNVTTASGIRGALGTGFGALGGALGAAEQYSPYMVAAGQLMGVDINQLFNPGNATQFAEGLGFYHTSQVAGQAVPEFGPQKQIMSNILSHTGDTWATPGEVNQFQMSMLGEGVRPGAELDQYLNVFSDLQHQGIPWTQEMAPLLRESTLLGEPGSFDAAKEAIKGMTDAADSAGVTLTEMTGQVLQTSETLQGMGLPKGQGAVVATDFARATGLSPLVLDQAMQSPLVRMRLLQQGAEPGIEGLWAQNGGAVRALGQTVRQTLNMIQGGESDSTVRTAGGSYTITAREKALGRIGQYIPGMTPEAARHILRTQNEATRNANLDAMARTYGRDVDRLYEGGLSGADRQSLQDLQQDTGFAHTHGFSWRDIQREAQRPGSPISAEDLRSLNQLSPQDRAAQLQDMLRKRNQYGEDTAMPGKTTSMGGVQIELSGAARQFFNLKSPDSNRRTANTGRGRLNELISDSPGHTPSQEQIMQYWTDRAQKVVPFDFGDFSAGG